MQHHTANDSCNTTVVSGHNADFSVGLLFFGGGGDATEHAAEPATAPADLKPQEGLSLGLGLGSGVGSMPTSKMDATVENFLHDFIWKVCQNRIQMRCLWRVSVCTVFLKLLVLFFFSFFLPLRLVVFVLMFICIIMQLIFCYCCCVCLFLVRDCIRLAPDKICYSSVVGHAQYLQYQALCTRCSVPV